MAEELETEITDLLARVDVPPKNQSKTGDGEAWSSQKKALEAKIAKLEQDMEKNNSIIAGNSSFYLGCCGDDSPRFSAILCNRGIHQPADS